MEKSLSENYLHSSLRQFNYYKSLADKAIAQVTDDHLYWRYNEDSNSIVTIIKHMHGNMMSRWTDFLNSDGEKEWRNRDDEFWEEPLCRQDLLKIWEEGWTCLFDALDELSSEDLRKIIYIRNEGHTVMEAINRQMCHYSYHIGQIIYIAKMIAEEPWKSLSIPRGESNIFNAKKFDLDKSIRHFTEDTK